MKVLKVMPKKPSKNERERQVLLGLVEYYIKTGKPVGSNTLKELGFANLSSATIRNYFTHLEEDGLLIQQHASGGRLPTSKALRLYALECQETPQTGSISLQDIDLLQSANTREIATFLQSAAEHLAEQTHCAAFLSAPRFEQDFITGLRIVPIDPMRCVCILITDFGEVITETLHIPHKLSNFSSKRLEGYFQWRLTGSEKPETLSKEEEELAQNLYNELMVRYVVNYSRFNNEEIYRTGFSRLLSYPDFQDPALLTNGLSLFENTHGMRLLLKECQALDKLKFWIGDDLIPYSPDSQPNCAVIAIPYHVNHSVVGAIGLLGPIRIPYQTLFATLRDFSEHISERLTNNIYKFKITLRQPKQQTIDLKQNDLRLITETKRLFLEDKRDNEIDDQRKPSRRKPL